jgi:polyhydroxyalkanoate synthase
MHSQYLRSCYLENKLVTHGGFSLLGTPIDLAKVKTPLYVLGAETDHIAPWRSTYRTTQLVGGSARFTLTSSGHVAGIVNPPGNPKSAYWTAGETTIGERADDWRARAKRMDGSWWQDWVAWAAERSGKHVAPPRLPEGDPAPGGYVRGIVGAFHGAEAKAGANGARIRKQSGKSKDADASAPRPARKRTTR